MITSKLTSKAQTTIPQSVRAALHLREGDELLYQIDGERIIVTRRNRSAWTTIRSVLSMNGTRRRTGKPMPTFKFRPALHF